MTAHPDPVIADALTRCQYTAGPRTLAERFEDLRAGADACAGLGWFAVTLPSGVHLLLCSIHAARAILEHSADSHPIVLRCPACQHVGSHTALGLERCRRCHAVHPVQVRP